MRGEHPIDSSIPTTLEGLPKLPENLRHEIHALAIQVHQEAEQIEETEEALFCTTRTLEYVAGVGSSILTYFATKMDQANNEAAAAICDLLGITLENEKEKAEQAAEAEAEAAAVTEIVAEVAQKIADATDDDKKIPSAANDSTNVVPKVQHGKKSQRKKSKPVIY